MQQKFLKVNGVKLHYIEEGSGELVILLHGFPEFWYTWRQQIPVLAKHYRVVAPDMRGYNLSDKPEGVANYRIDVLAKDIADLITALGFDKVILVGHDWGAAVAWATATIYPQKIKKLGIINVPHPQEMGKAFFSFNLSQYEKSSYMFFFQLPWLPERFIGKDLPEFFKNVFANLSPTGAVPPDDVIAKYVEAYSRPGTITATLNYYRAAMRYLNALKPTGKLPMPVLMLWGEQDKALGKELTYNTKDYCSDLEIIYDPASGHFLQHDNPDLVNTKLLQFFNKP